MSGWTDGKWEIAWGELRSERDGSVDTVDGWETVGNSLGRALLEGSSVDTVDGWEIVGKNSLGRSLLGGSHILRSRDVSTGFQYKFHQCDCPYCAPKIFQVVCKHWAMGHA